LLDTNVVSELRRAKSGKANPSVTAWAAQIPAGSLYLSAIALLELEMGVLQLERRDASQGMILRAWLDRHVLQRLLAACSRLTRRWRFNVLDCTCQTG
jgi:predicted nucleic acid-binding protein